MPDNTHSSDLRVKTTRSVLWRSIEQFGSTGLQFVFAIFIARALSPEDYGIVGMMMVAIALSRVFVESGFGSALIQKKSPTEEDYSSVFYFNLFMSLVLYTILFLCSPLVANFFDQPMLHITLRVMSIILVIDALSMAQNTLLVKNLQFKRTAMIATCSATFSGFVGVTLAYTGHGVWSLIAKALAYAAFRSLVLWIMSEWRPKVRINLEPVRTFFAYSSKLLVSALIDTLFRNLLTLVIGKYYTAADLGNYSKADQLHQVPAVMTTSVVVQ
jgi:teichuronic acid exporter